MDRTTENGRELDGCGKVVGRKCGKERMRILDLRGVIGGWDYALYVVRAQSYQN